MRRKTNRKGRRTNKRKLLMYGGQAAPAPANIFSAYDALGVQTSLNNFLQAAYSVKLAAAAIQATSTYQNKYTSDPSDLTRGTRYLQLDSAGSFQTATQTMQSSLDGLYRALTSSTTSPPMPGPSTPPPSPWNPPPLAFRP